MIPVGIPINILMVDDDEEDREMTRKACLQGLVINTFSTVKNGYECTDYLTERGRLSDPEAAPRPSIILLDLNMPGKDGRAALKEIKGNPDLRQIPVVVLTTSKSSKTSCDPMTWAPTPMSSSPFSSEAPRGDGRPREVLVYHRGVAA